MLLRTLFALVATFALATAAKWPHPRQQLDGVPASFDCAMRRAAYEYGKHNIPRKGSFPSLYYALNLNDPACPPTELPDDEPEHPVNVPTPPADAVHVAPGDSIQAAADLVAGRASGAAKTVVLRGGTHYLPAPLLLTSKHSGITFQAFPGEQPVVSGGTPLKNLKWTPYNVTKPPVVPPGGNWVQEQNQNAVFGGTNDNKTYHIYGELDSAAACEAACKANGCDIYTWHDPHQGAYARQCWFRLDGNLDLTAESGHVSGWNATKLFPAVGANIWVADVGGQVSDVPGLQLDGARATRARYPNIPGGIEVSCGYGCMVPGGSGEWTPPQFNRFGPVDFYTDNITQHTRNDTPSGWFQHYMIGVDGLCSVYHPPVSYWCSAHPSGGGAFAFRTPSGVTPKAGALPHSPYKDPSQAVFFVWRPARWANWMFEVGDYDAKANNFTFGYGGFQGARGNNNGGDFFVENVMEELDYPGEFFFDKAAGKLYLFHNGTGAPRADAEVVVPQLMNLVNISGTQWDPVKDVKHVGIKYTASRYTYMYPHGVPAGGDWALDRIGAVFLQGTEGVTFDQCTFERLDGNGVMVSGYNRNATVSNSDFAYLGGNAIANWGYTNETSTDPGRPGVPLANAPAAGVDGTDGEHPRYTHAIGNVAREVGLYEKQSSFYFQAKTAQSVISGNVFFNGPRAGINYNDGFGGGDELSHNLVFSTCRESGDHGPFNSWDRQPYQTSVRTGEPSMIMQWREIHHNFFIDNYSPQEDVDNDDGSCYYHTHDNFFVYGGRAMKNDFGGHDNHHYNNVYGYTGGGIGVTGTLDDHEDYFYGNKMVTLGNDVGGFTCSGTGKTVIYGNEYFTPTGGINECKMPLAKWQAQGEDKGSTVAKLPPDATIIGWAKELLGF